MDKIIEKIIELSLNSMPYKEALRMCIDTDQSNQYTPNYHNLILTLKIN